MNRLFLLSIIVFCSRYSFAQTSEAAYIQGNISISPKIFSRHKIKKEVIYSVHIRNEKLDSFMHKTRFYDSLGNITKETYPFLTGVGSTLFYYDTHGKLIKQASPDTPLEDVEYTYDQLGNLICTSKKSNGKILTSTLVKYNSKQQPVKQSDLIGDADTTSSELYCYNKVGRIDSIIIFQNSGKYIEHCHYSKNYDTVTVFYNANTTSGTNRCTYNKNKQLIRIIKTETGQQYSQETAIEFIYNPDGTLSQENITASEYQGNRLASQHHNSYNHYYFK